MTFPRVGADVVINTGDAERELRRFIGVLNDTDSAMDDVIQQANRLETSLNSISTANIDVTVNESEIDSALGLINDLEQDTTVRINVQEAEIEEVVDSINDIRNMQAIELTVSIAGTAVDLLRGGGGIALSGLQAGFNISGIGNLIEMQSLLAQMEAQVGELIPDADRLINEIFTDGWGNSREEIASVLTQAQQLGIEMESLEVATRNALILSDITGEDPTEILRTMSTLVRTEIVPDFETAGDVIASMWQEGAGSADDLLDTLNEYSTTFQALGFSAEDIQSFLTAGLEAGIFNTDLIADSFREFNIRANEVADGVGLLDEQFADLGVEELAEQFRQGEIAGDDFIREIITSLSEIEDPLEQSRLAVEIFGTQWEDIDPQAFISALDEADSAIIDFDGMLDDAGIALSETLPQAWERAQRVISTGLGEALDEQFNITEMLDDLTSDITTFFDSLDAGTSIGGSFRIAFDDNEIVEVLLDVREVLVDGFFAVALGISDLAGALGFDTASLEGFIGGLAGGELTIDLATAETTEDISDAVSDALNRGVEASDIVEQLSTQFDEAVEIGDVEQVVALRDAIQGLADMASGENLMSQFGVTQEDINTLSESLDVGINGVFNETFAEGVFNAFFSEFNIPEDQQAEIQSQLENVLGNPELVENLFNPESLVDLDELNATADGMIEVLRTSLESALNAEDFSEALNIASALDEALGSTGEVDAVEMFANDMGVSLDNVEESANDASMGVVTSMEEIDDATITATDSTVQALIDAGEAYTTLQETAVEELDTTEQRYRTFSENVQAETENIAAKLGGLNLALVDVGINIGNIPAGFGGNITNNTTLNQTNNISNPAQQGNADAQVAQSISAGFP